MAEIAPAADILLDFDVIIDALLSLVLPSAWSEGDCMGMPRALLSNMPPPKVSTVSLTSVPETPRGSPVCVLLSPPTSPRLTYASLRSSTDRTFPRFISEDELDLWLPENTYIEKPEAIFPFLLPALSEHIRQPLFIIDVNANPVSKLKNARRAATNRCTSCPPHGSISASSTRSRTTQRLLRGAQKREKHKRCA